MSVSPTTSALLSLLPTYTAATLPPALHEAAIGLLAQSRSRAAVLKPEEEVARGWACAELSVKRLQTHLNLPAVFSNPPCPPRTYKKLYQFLDRVLVSHAATPKPASAPVTPKKRGQQVLKGSVDAAPVTQSSNASGKIKQNAKLNSAAKKRKIEHIDDASQLAPSWLGATIRHLCKKVSMPAAVPHVFVGVVSLLKAQETDPSVQDVNENDIPALIAAVLLLVSKKMQESAGTEMTGAASRRLIFQELIALGRVSGAKAGALFSNTGRLLEDQAESWKATEWYGNVPDGGENLRDSSEANGVEHKDDSHQRQRGVNRALLTPQLQSRRSAGPTEGLAEAHGLGFIDWLSEARREDYQIWKAGMLEKIERMEQSQA